MVNTNKITKNLILFRHLKINLLGHSSIDAYKNLFNKHKFISSIFHNSI